MIIVLKRGASEEDLEHVVSKVRNKGLEPVISKGQERTVVHVIGDLRETSTDEFNAISCVEKAVRILKPYKLASKEHHPETTVIEVADGVEIGNSHFEVIAGPCSAESEEQVMESARMLKKMGVKIMRASVFKPRTSPYSFQGLGIEGLKLLKKAKEETGMLTETEVMDVRDVHIAAEHVDILRVGARNMQNFDLLKELGKIDNPVILKRGMSATIKEFIMAAEYILFNGNPKVILCERGIRTFETAYRNTLDVGAVALLKQETHLPIIVDPSHAAGNRELIPSLSRAGIAAGADGLLVEVHPNPEEAVSDAKQTLSPEQFKELLEDIRPVVHAVGKEF